MLNQDRRKFPRCRSIDPRCARTVVVLADGNHLQHCERHLDEHDRALIAAGGSEVSAAVRTVSLRILVTEAERTAISHIADRETGGNMSELVRRKVLA